MTDTATVLIGSVLALAGALAFVGFLSHPSFLRGVTAAVLLAIGTCGLMISLGEIGFGDPWALYKWPGG